MPDIQIKMVLIILFYLRWLKRVGCFAGDLSRDECPGNSGATMRNMRCIFVARIKSCYDFMKDLKRNVVFFHFPPQRRAVDVEGLCGFTAAPAIFIQHFLDHVLLA